MNDLEFIPAPSGYGYKVLLNDKLIYLVFRGDELDDHDWIATDIHFNIIDQDNFRYKLFERLELRDFKI